MIGNRWRKNGGFGRIPVVRQIQFPSGNGYLSPVGQGPRDAGSYRGVDHNGGGGAVTNKPEIEGEIVSVGPGARGDDGSIHALDVKNGDRVLFGKWSGTEIKVDGEELLIMKESDIMGVIEA